MPFSVACWKESFVTTSRWCWYASILIGAWGGIVIRTPTRHVRLPPPSQVGFSRDSRSISLPGRPTGLRALMLASTTQEFARATVLRVLRSARLKPCPTYGRFQMPQTEGERSDRTRLRVAIAPRGRTTPSVVLPVESVTRHAGIPVRERAVRIVLPCPDVQRVERRRPEAIGGLEVVKELSVQLGRAGVGFVPVGREHEKVGAGDAQAAGRRRLVEDDLGFGGVDLAVRDEREIHEVEPHRAIVGAADAPEEKTVALGFSDRHVAEALRGVAHDLDQRVALVPLLCRLVLCRHHVRVVPLREPV